MIKHFVHTIKKVITLFFEFIISIPSRIKYLFQYAKEFSRDSKRKLGNLYYTNIELGLYHIRNNNLRDAILRFWLVDKVFKPSNEYNQYLLGWAYTLKGDTLKASDALSKAGNQDAANLAIYLGQPIDKIQNVPDEIINHYKNLILEGFWQSLSFSKQNVVEQFVNFCVDGISIIPKDFRALDIGCRTGLVGESLRHKISHQFDLCGVDESESMLEIAHKKSINKIKVYDRTFKESAEGFLSSSKQKFTIILDFMNICRCRDPGNILKKVHEMLDKEGYFCALYPISQSITKISSSRLHFNYNEQYITDKLQDAGLSLVASQFLTNDKKVVYLMVLTQKNT